MVHTLRPTNDHGAVVYTRAVAIRFDPLDVSKLKYLQSQENGSPAFLYLGWSDLRGSWVFVADSGRVSIGRDRRLLLRLVGGVLGVYCSSHRVVIMHLLPRSYGNWRVLVGRQRFRPCACGLYRC